MECAFVCVPVGGDCGVVSGMGIFLYNGPRGYDPCDWSDNRTRMPPRRRRATLRTDGALSSTYASSLKEEKRRSGIDDIGPTNEADKGSAQLRLSPLVRRRCRDFLTNRRGSQPRRVSRRRGTSAPRQYGAYFFQNGQCVSGRDLSANATPAVRRRHANFSHSEVIRKMIVAEAAIDVRVSKYTIAT